MTDLTNPDVKEIVSHLREIIAKEEIALHEKMTRLRAYRDEARSDEAYDNITEHMREASRRHHASIAPVRRELDAIAKAIVSVKMVEPFIVSKDRPEA